MGADRPDAPAAQRACAGARTRARADIEVETGAAALEVAASGVAGAVASFRVAEVLGYT
jgi:hypothetical protein